MRLVPFLLTATLAAQTPGKLPWDAATALSWKTGDSLPASALPSFPPVPSPPPLLVRLTADGALRVIDDRGIILLRTGLPGRPQHLWRDGGIPVPGDTWSFPFLRTSPLAQGIGGLAAGSRDFRQALEGLLWILSDDEKMITLVHPATARLCYLPLPGGSRFRLVFHADRLEIRETPAQEGAPAGCWSLPWMALLPHLIQLGQPNSANRPSGTALLPFAKD